MRATTQLWPFVRIAVAAWLLTITVPLQAHADKIVLNSGRTISGEVSAEDDRTVTLEVAGPGMTFAQRVNKSQIKVWDRPARVGPSYVLIPLFGRIGTEATASTLKAAIATAAESKPRYLVVVIDSPGGDVAEIPKIIDVLDEASRNTETIAYVKNSYSAAAVIAMSCRRIFMEPHAAIGAAVPYKPTENGPAELEAKFRSAVVACFRQAAVHGGHDDLLMRGMCELNTEIILQHENGHPVLRMSGPGKVIKSKGEILTLTADEAAECGLASIATDLTDLGKQLTGGEWHEANRRAWNLVIRKA
ncbi:MAG: hypothetical protein JWN24_3862 [Phycisphaerales bacterium]|nr:hypothetical protein [Phycisphaerales bacterium]